MPIGAYKLNAISRRGAGAVSYDAEFRLIRTITNPNNNTTDTDDGFGVYSVDINDTYFVVGAAKEDASTTTDSGIAYVYNSATGSLVSTLINPYPTTNDYAGLRVAVSATQVIVGEYGTLSTGNAYIYSASTGNLLYTLNNPNPPGPPYPADTFAESVDISDNYVIVGQFAAELPGYNSSGSGRVYIYSAATGTLLYNIPNPWPSTSTFNRFGWDVAITDQYAVVADNTVGNAYVYSTTTGNLVYTLQATGMTSVNQIDVSDNYVVVGTPYYSSGSGRVFVFNLSDGSLRYTINNPNQYFTANNDYFGSIVSISNSYIMAHAEFENAPGSATSYVGLSYIFNIDTGNLVQSLPSPYGNISNHWNGVAISNRYAIEAVSPDATESNSRILFYSRISSDTTSGYVATGYVTAGYVATTA